MPTQRTNWCGGVLKVSGPREDLDIFIEAARDVERNIPFSLGVLIDAPFDLGEHTEAEWNIINWGMERDVHENMSFVRGDARAVYQFSTYVCCLCQGFFEKLSALWITLSFEYTGYNPADGGRITALCSNGILDHYRLPEDQDEGGSENNCDDNGNTDDDEEDCADDDEQGSDDPLEY